MKVTLPTHLNSFVAAAVPERPLRNMKPRLLLSAILVSINVATAFGVSYTFTKVADESTVASSGETFSSFNEFVSVSSGTAVFYGNWSGLTQRGVFTGKGGPITKIAKTGDSTAIGPLNSFRDLSIDGGTAAFVGQSSGSADGIFTSSGGPLTAIVKDGDTAPVGTFTGYSGPAISGGITAFTAIYNSGNGHGIFMGNGGPLTTIAKSGDAAPVGTFNDFTGVAFEGGPVAFRGTYNNAASRGIFRLSSGTLTEIAKFGDAAPTGTFSDFAYRTSISGNTVAFLGIFNGTDSSGIFTGDGEALTTIVKTGDPVPSGNINEIGYPVTSGDTTAFIASWNNFNSDGILTGNGGPLNKVIARGDSLFGGTLVAFPPPDSQAIEIDAEGNIAFLYRLDDGRQGIAIASPIVAEPSSIILAICTFAALPRRPRKRLPQSRLTTPSGRVGF
jgi:hypothetical protein